MAVTKDVEAIGMLALLAVLAAVLLSTFKDQLAGISKQIAVSVGNVASGAGSAAAGAVTGAADGAGQTLGDWIWNGLTGIFPSLGDTSADPSELNYQNARSPVASYLDPTGEATQVWDSFYPVDISSWN